MSKEFRKQIKKQMKTIAGWLVRDGQLSQATIDDPEFWKNVEEKLFPNFLPPPRDNDRRPDHLQMLELQLLACAPEPPEQLLKDVEAFANHLREVHDIDWNQPDALPMPKTPKHMDKMIHTFNMRRVVSILKDQLTGAGAVVTAHAQTPSGGDDNSPVENLIETPAGKNAIALATEFKIGRDEAKVVLNALEPLDRRVVLDQISSRVFWEEVDWLYPAIRLCQLDKKNPETTKDAVGLLLRAFAFKDRHNLPPKDLVPIKVLAQEGRKQIDDIERQLDATSSSLSFDDADAMKMRDHSHRSGALRFATKMIEAEMELVADFNQVRIDHVREIARNPSLDVMEFVDDDLRDRMLRVERLIQRVQQGGAMRVPRENPKKPWTERLDDPPSSSTPPLP